MTIPHVGQVKSLFRDLDNFQRYRTSIIYGICAIYMFFILFKGFRLSLLHLGGTNDPDLSHMFTIWALHKTTLSHTSAQDGSFTHIIGRVGCIGCA